ncbi:bifunctional molybdenum cofactor biosynthesis protein MoaC/MoaB, partial [Flavobacteriaceae bacterium]|nr:bifunctional molybdenum cofactor biosynthesis protein MoaC/MoaB [Flavobacteriaceae bacterium]
LEIQVLCTLKTIYKTGVEVEAMHGASIVALNMYDMLKPIDKGVEIHQIKLLQKTGGKTDTLEVKAQVNAAIVVCSDSVSAGKKEDRAGKALQEALQKWNVKVTDYLIVPDEIPLIQAALKEQHKKGSSLIVFTGGTGLSPRDVTPEALRPLLDKTIPGMEEAIRNYGQNRTPYAMLSRSIVGMIGSSLVLGLPGSTKGAEESLNAIFPAALHLFDIINGGQHTK